MRFFSKSIPNNWAMQMDIINCRLFPVELAAYILSLCIPIEDIDFDLLPIQILGVIFQLFT